MTACLLLLAATLTGCAAPEYHGPYSGIDGVLWRQVAAFEDPLSKALHSPTVDDPAAYLDSLEAEPWDGQASSVDSLELDEGGVVLYDVTSASTTASVSIFIASGPRPDVAADDGRPYAGPSEVYTCFSVNAVFDPLPARSDRELLEGCPASLVSRLSPDAAFASDEVFDG